MLRIPEISLPAIAIGAIMCVAALGGAAIADNKDTAKVPDGLAMSDFKGYESWQVVNVSHDGDITDVILGNPAIIKAYEAGIPANGKPFPDGVRLAKIHWNAKKQPDGFPQTVSGTLHDIDFMVRDSKHFAATSNWGYAQFNYEAASDKFSPLGKGAACGAACHTAAAKKDFVFTEFPKR